MSRLPPAPTQRLNRETELEFHYLGRRMTGHKGDSLAAALYANGVRIFSRSLKYHRPRGLYCLDGEAANTMMTIDGVPNESAETKQLGAGMQVSAQNVKGSPETDRYGILDRFDRLMPAGFYYRVFHRPARLWPFFLDRIRKMAGLGVLDIDQAFDDSKRFEIFLTADVAVLGGGTAGMSAALAAAEQGLRVCLFEQRPWLGGHDDWRVAEFGGKALFQRARELAGRVEDSDNIRVFTHAPVTGIWGLEAYQPIPAENLADSVRGFRLVTGRVQRLGESRANLWLNLSPHVAVRIPKRDLAYFGDLDPRGLVGKRLEVRGWVQKRRGELRITVRHRAALTVLD